MKGFAGILVLFTMLMVAIILLSSTYQIKNEENNTTYIPQIKNFLTIYEFNLKNMSYDCNWEKEAQDVNDCLTNGSNLIFDSVKLNLLVSCTKTPLEKITDTNTYHLTISCTNKVLLQKNTNFEVQKTVYLIPKNP